MSVTPPADETPASDAPTPERKPTQRITETPAPTEASAPEAGRDDFVGLAIGDAVLKRRIGEGGMGLVYEAWQEPPGRLVAAKLMREAVATDEARFRFQHEARVLASLRHPAIAQIYSSGTHPGTPEIPYFLMEYVPGAKELTHYVTEARLSLDDTLSLAAEVCRGVQAGHARGIIHRDLKPANVLVDAQGQAKIIDFGLARVARADEDAATPRTQTGELMGTVPYMSPEQFTGSRDAVDTRTDVYALGVILYEMLTGRLPYDFAGLGIIEIIGVIQKKPPVPPARLRPELEGDVSVILLKALAKEPDARYASAAALADELERYVERRPILARPPSVGYQIKMYAKRRKAAFVSMIAVAVMLIGSLIAISIFASRESRAREQSERDAARAQALLRESAGFIPEVADHLDNKLGAIVGTTRVRDLLAEKLGALAQRLAALEGAGEDPDVAFAVGSAESAVASIRGGAASANLGEGREALAHFENAVVHFRRAARARPADERFREAFISSLLSLSTQHNMAGRTKEARAHLAEAAQALAGLTGDHPHVIGQRIDYERALGHIEWFADQREAALAAYERAHALLQTLPRKPGQERAYTRLRLQSHLDLASSFMALGRADDARVHLDALQEIASKANIEGSNANELEGLWHVERKLGDFAMDTGDPAAARLHQERALAIAELILQRDKDDAAAHQRVRVAHGVLGGVLERAGEPLAARPHYLKALAATRREVAADRDNIILQWDLRVALTRMGAIESQLGAGAAAKQLLAEARAIQEARLNSMPERAEEAAGLAEVEYTEARYELDRADPDGALEAHIAAFKRGMAKLDSAIARLKALDEAGTIPAADKGNLASWGGLATKLREILPKLEALR